MKRAIVLVAVLLMVAAPAAAQTTNDPAYWEGQTEHPSLCYKHEGADLESNIHGFLNETGTGVILNPFDPDWPGDHWELLVVKGGTDDAVYPHPSAGPVYLAPLNPGGEQAEVSHWIVCKGEGPDETTTTTSTTTTVPETTTTVPETTTTVPVTTTLPVTTTVPVTSTTAPTTTVPETVPSTVPTTTTPDDPCIDSDGDGVFRYDTDGDGIEDGDVCPLPETGASDILVPLGIGAFGLILLGSAALAGSRRRV